jgi:hypothetical protein
MNMIYTYIATKVVHRKKQYMFLCMVWLSFTMLSANTSTIKICLATQATTHYSLNTTSLLPTQTHQQNIQKLTAAVTSSKSFATSIKNSNTCTTSNNAIAYLIHCFKANNFFVRYFLLYNFLKHSNN